MTFKIHDAKIKFFQARILTWYETNGRIFSWRKSNLNNYQLIIAEVLLQRTKAETVQKFYIKFLEQYPNWKSINETNDKKLEDVLKPLGLYKQRAKRLKSLAGEMCSRNSRVPRTKEEIEKLPFAGQYITNAILLLIRKQHAPLLDVNMVRVLERFFGPRKLADIRYDTYLQELAWRVVNHKDAKKINWGILDFAAKICTSPKPKCSICCVVNKCKNC